MKRLDPKEFREMAKASGVGTISGAITQVSEFYGDEGKKLSKHALDIYDEIDSIIEDSRIDASAFIGQLKDISEDKNVGSISGYILMMRLIAIVQGNLEALLELAAEEEEDRDHLSKALWAGNVLNAIDEVVPLIQSSIVECLGMNDDSSSKGKNNSGGIITPGSDEWNVN